ncbi:LapB repeat-containing protein [Listeria innocua]|uniref:LapB repeat-containing protein n=1 Tax=Listeria innocua TaxID=1642 RepID=UPI0016271AB0|nr:LapB repeat-containing protein [Listeria innocua]MBC1377457.1 LapB repeat-containing protein [Listeria innocua]
MSIKSNIMKVGICSVMVMVPLSQVSLPSFAAEEQGLQASQDVVNIPDSELKKQLNSHMGKSATADITEDEMSRLNNVSLDGAITDLTGLEYAKNVTRLSFRNINLSYEVVTKLPQLKDLSIMGYNVTSDKIPNLNNMTSLETLNLYESNYDNSVLAKINEIPNLKTLNISYNKQITNISSLKSLPNLTDLLAINCQIDDFRGIADFPKLKNFTANYQRFEDEASKNLKSSELTFNEAEQTLFIPFKILDKQTIYNYDGTILQYDTNPANLMIEVDSSYEFTDDKTSISQEGVTLKNFSKENYDGMEMLYIVAMFDGSNIATPPNLANGKYDITGILSGGLYNVDHSVSIEADDNISYTQGQTVTPEQFLKDINAIANGGTITSDFADKVDFSTPGTYTVTLNASNSVGLTADPVQVTVTIVEQTVITAETEVSYNMNDAKTEAEFLADIKAVTNDNTAITTDFDTVVDLTKAGEYTVTLNAETGKQKATPLKVTVKIVDPTPTPDPIPDPTPTPDPASDTDPVVVEDPGTSLNSEAPANSTSEDPSASTPKATEKANSGNSTVVTASKASLPKTGDSLPVTGVAVGFLVLGLGVLIARKK